MPFDLIDPREMAEKSVFPPRDYQKSCFDRAVELYNLGVFRQLYVLATGLGKTIIFSQLAGYFPEHFKHGVLVLVHRDELAFQGAEKIQQSNPYAKVGIEKAEYSAEPDCDFVVASVQTVGRKNSKRLYKFLDRFGIIITDEAHHVKRGGQYANVLNAFGVGPKKDKQTAKDLDVPRLSFGFTATPNRADGLGLDDFYDVIAKNYDISFGVENSWLVPISAFQEKTGTNLDSVKSRAGDLAEGELETAINISPRNAKIVTTYLKMVRGELDGQSYIPRGLAIVFTAGVKHAHDLARAFMAAGVPSVAVDGTTDKDLRKSFVSEFKKGNIKVLCNCGVFTEGFDAVACDSIFMARPTTSQTLYLQMIGRGTRPVCNVNFDEPDTRARAILQSEKPCMTLVDFVDNRKKNDLVVAPRLVGLRPEFNSKGRKLFGEIKKKLKEKQEENPTRPLKEATTFEEIDIIAEKVDIWDLADDTKPVRQISPFKWFEVEEDVWHLSVPLKPREFIIRLEGDALGKWKSTKIYPAQMHVDGEGNKQWSKQRVVEGEKQIAGFENAVRAVDSWVRKKAPTCLNLMYHSPKWGKKDASPKQIYKLKNEFNIQIPDGMKLSRGDAAKLIDAAIQKERHKRYLQRTNGSVQKQGTESAQEKKAES